jgi:biopolymer transport protein ExbB
MSVRNAVGILVVLSFCLWVIEQSFIAPVKAQDRDSPASASNVAAGDEGGSAAGGRDAESGVPRVEASESFLAWMIRASGWIGLVIALMSFYLIALVVWMSLHYRRAAAVPPELVSDVHDLLEQNKYSDAYHRLAADSSFLGRVLAAGVRKLPTGLAHAQRAMEMANEDATMEMEHRTTYLATVGTLGPMIGLVGTVYGMIMAFRVIALRGSSAQANQLAAGISTALFATLEGIAISIPAIYFYAMFRNRIARLSLEVGLAAEPLLEQFAPGVRATQGAVPAPGPPAHPHPFAVSAALAAAASTNPRSALPPAEP